MLGAAAAARCRRAAGQQPLSGGDPEAAARRAPASRQPAGARRRPRQLRSRAAHAREAARRDLHVAGSAVVARRHPRRSQPRRPHLAHRGRNSMSKQDTALIHQVVGYQHQIAHRQTLLARRACPAEPARLRARGGAQPDRGEGRLRAAALQLGPVADPADDLRAAGAARRRPPAPRASRRRRRQRHRRAASASAIPVSTSIPGDRYSSVVGIAMQYLGVPYVWGGESPSGFDCSGSRRVRLRPGRRLAAALHGRAVRLPGLRLGAAEPARAGRPRLLRRPRPRRDLRRRRELHPRAAHGLRRPHRQPQRRLVRRPSTTARSGSWASRLAA